MKNGTCITAIDGNEYRIHGLISCFSTVDLSDHAVLTAGLRYNNITSATTTTAATSITVLTTTRRRIDAVVAADL